MTRILNDLDSRGRAPPASRDRAATPTGPSRSVSGIAGIDWRGALAKLPSLFFQPPARDSRFNRACSRFAIITALGLLAIGAIARFI